MRASTIFLAIALSSFVATAACSGSSADLDEGSGGTGGKILDSGDLDAGDLDVWEAATETGLDALPDAEQDAPPDQSVQQDTGMLDGEALEGSLFDLTMPDVALNDSGATLQGCYDCAVTSCSSEMAACEADDTCRTILLCLFEDQCFGGSGIDYMCGLGCATKAGVTGIEDPAVAIAMEAGECIAGACPEDCALPEDGGL